MKLLTITIVIANILSPVPVFKILVEKYTHHNKSVMLQSSTALLVTMNFYLKIFQYQIDLSHVQQASGLCNYSRSDYGLKNRSFRTYLII